MKYKKGITLITIVIYLVLFFLFTSVITVIATKLDSNLLDDRGSAINLNNMNKLEYNLINSADSSTLATCSVENNIYTLSFSNGDIYTFNNLTGIIYKNNGKLITDVENLRVYPGDSYANVEVTFKKYLNIQKKSIKVNVNTNWYNASGLITHLDAIDNGGKSNNLSNTLLWKDFGSMEVDAKISTNSNNIWRDNGIVFEDPSANITNTVVSFNEQLSLESITVEYSINTITQLGGLGNSYIYPVNFYNANNQFCLRFGNRINVSLMYLSGNNTVLHNNKLPIDQGKNYTFTYIQDGLATRKLYVNGVLMKQYTALDLQPILIKKITLQGYSTGDYIIHSFRVYNRALSVEEINYNYELDKMRFGE